MPKSAEAKTAGQTTEKKTKRSQSRGKKEEETPVPSLDLRQILELPRPKKAKTAWTFYLCGRLGDLQNQKADDQKQSELFKIASEEWQKLPKDQVVKFEKLAEQDKERYKHQMEEFEKNGYFTMEDGQLSHMTVPQNPKFIESIVQPKNPSSGYNIYIGQATQEYRKEHPDLKAIEILSAVAQQWSKIDDKERQKFELLAQKDKERHEQQVKDLLNQGYFIMPDGSKSSDHIRKVKQKRVAKTEEEKQEDPVIVEKPKLTSKSLKRKASDFDKDGSITPTTVSKRKATEKSKDDLTPSSPSPKSKSPKRKVAESEKSKTSQRSRSRSRSPQKKAAVKKGDKSSPVTQSTSPKEITKFGTKANNAPNITTMITKKEKSPSKKKTE